jgi:BlaI family transcriptional regulator, penicillinase repressor
MTLTTAISDAEAHVMEVLWQKHPMGTDEIADALRDSQNWQMATVKTLVNRLLNKGAISAEKESRRYLYSPVLQREEWLSGQSLGLLDRLFQGSLTPLVAHFSAQRKLTAAELKALKQLIKDYDHE